jgi:hypothetical protein
MSLLVKNPFKFSRVFSLILSLDTSKGTIWHPGGLQRVLVDGKKVFTNARTSVLAIFRHDETIITNPPTPIRIRFLTIPRSSSSRPETGSRSFHTRKAIVLKVNKRLVVSC